MKKIVILIGPPGAGKSTQAQLLADKAGLEHLETSRLLKAAFNRENKRKFVQVGGKKYSLAKERAFWKNGDICSPPFTAYLIKEKVKALFANQESIVFSGSPRSVEEAKEIIPLLEKLYGRRNIKVFLLEVPAEETIFRNSHRRICSLMRHPILYSEETKKLKFCPLDGSRLIKRKGLDNPKTIRVRLEVYKKKTLPLIEYFKERKIKVARINGVGSVSAVFQRIQRVIGKT